MNYEIVILDSVYYELDEAIDYYELKQLNLGKRLYLDFKESLKSISHSPELYEKKHQNFRQLKLKIFPYFLVFEVIKSQIIVYRFFHAKRNPKRKFKF